jgi:Lipid A 3-O-deacylase (PagL)
VRRVARKLIVALVFFLEGECALAQAVAPAPLDAGWRVFASYGQASAPRSQGFAEQASFAVARDFDLGSRFSLGIEFTPLFVVNQTRVDLPGRPREVAYAGAVAPVLAWTYVPKASRFGLRLEGGVGIFWGFSPIPAEGSRFNFLGELAGLVLVRAGSDHLVSLGVRRVHVSNMGLAGPDNPGLSFYSGVVGLSWAAR